MASPWKAGSISLRCSRWGVSSSRITELGPTIGSRMRAPSPGCSTSGGAWKTSLISSGSERITNGALPKQPNRKALAVALPRAQQPDGGSQSSWQPSARVAGTFGPGVAHSSADGSRGCCSRWALRSCSPAWGLEPSAGRARSWLGGQSPLGPRRGAARTRATRMRAPFRMITSSG